MNDRVLPDAESRQSKAKYPKRRNGVIQYIRRVSHLSRRVRKSLRYKLQLWMWRTRREKSHFWLYRVKKTKKLGFVINSSPNLIRKSPKHEEKVKEFPCLKRKSPHLSPLGYDTERVSEEREQTCLKLCKAGGLSGMGATTLMQNQVAVGTNIFNLPYEKQGKESSVQFCDSSEMCPTAKPQHHRNTDSAVCGEISDGKVPKKTRPSQSHGVGRSPARSITQTSRQNQSINRDTGKRIAKRTVSSRSQHQADVGHNTLTEDIHEFLDDFYRMYGSFIPLQKSDLLRHLKRFNVNFTESINGIFSEVRKYQSGKAQKPIPSFQVVYKKHTLTLDDLTTLAEENWLNDQVINMYGELIMESVHHRVHFLNSFFHRQLVTKGYEGVKRWTKQVDLFSKSLLLVPVHLEVHWCLVTADIVKKKICLYDSQGDGLQTVARNILKFLMTEAKVRQRSAFESGWMLSLDANIPQQTNENDCGVFVLEYSRRLALAKPLRFSQNDMPKVRKRIYKELCDCKLHE